MDKELLRSLLSFMEERDYLQANANKKFKRVCISFTIQDGTIDDLTNVIELPNSEGTPLIALRLEYLDSKIREIESAMTQIAKP